MKRGFTLIEVLIALGILAAAVLICQAIISSTTLARTVKNKDLALKIANHKMEELRALGYANLPASGIFSDPLLSSLPNPSAAIEVSDYNSELKQVVVNVAWTELSGVSPEVELTTLLTKTGGLK